MIFWLTYALTSLWPSNFYLFSYVALLIIYFIKIKDCFSCIFGGFTWHIDPPSMRVQILQLIGVWYEYLIKYAKVPKNILIFKIKINIIKNEVHYFIFTVKILKSWDILGKKRYIIKKCFEKNLKEIEMKLSKFRNISISQNSTTLDGNYKQVVRTYIIIRYRYPLKVKLFTNEVYLLRELVT
jgi:hypothetical protein